MQKPFSYIVTVAAAFTAGLCTGLMLAPQSGKKLREQITSEARNQLKNAEEKLESVEAKLAEVNVKVQAAGRELGDKMMEAAQDAADEILPDIAQNSDSWNLSKGDVEQDLRNLSRR